MTWALTSEILPPNGVPVETKIDDAHGVRNVARLTRSNRLWFMASGMYVYYTPTHWRDPAARSLTDREKGGA